MIAQVGTIGAINGVFEWEWFQPGKGAKKAAQEWIEERQDHHWKRDGRMPPSTLYSDKRAAKIRYRDGRRVFPIFNPDYDWAEYGQ